MIHFFNILFSSDRISFELLLYKMFEMYINKFENPS